MIPGLDGLRALAYIAVQGGHVGINSFGWVGVQLFFVLSGFLITGILVRMKNSLNRRDFFVKFYGRRFLRIFPLYYFYLGVLASLVILLPYIDFKPWQKVVNTDFVQQLWFATFYVYDFFHASSCYEYSRFLTVLWSLSVEEQFYIFWPLILFLSPAKNYKRLFLSAVALGPVIRLLLSLLYQARPFPILLDNPELAIYVLPFSHIDAFAIGAYISQFDLPRPRLQFFALAFLVPAIGFASQFFVMGEIYPNSLGYEFPAQYAGKEIWGYSLLNYFFAVTIYSVARTGLFNRFLDHFSMRYLGKISYGLYVYHNAVIWLTLKLNAPVQLGTWGMFFFVLAGTTALASLSFFSFEKPINNLKEKFFPVRYSI